MLFNINKAVLRCGKLFHTKKYKFFIIDKVIFFPDNRTHSEDEMVILNSSDYFETHLASLIADYDKDTLVNLYQPIIGYGAFALFMSLWSEAKNQSITTMSAHEGLFITLQMNTSDFIKARKRLEAIGLLKTYLSSDGDTHLYTYQLYAPKTPDEFLNDPILSSTLKKQAGDSYFKRIQKIYLKPASEDYGEDISVSFKDIYSIDGINQTPMGKYLNRNNSMTLGFSYENFFVELGKVSQISSSSISSKEMKEVARIATVNGIDEETMAKLVVTVYNPHFEKGNRIDSDSLTRVCQDEVNYAFISKKKVVGVSSSVSSDSDLGQKITIMETTSPKDYLAVIQNGTKPASSDVRIINSLSRDFHLPNAVINALVDYVLAVNNNVLSKALCEKVAASLVREGINNVLDAMNYLKKTHNKSKKTYTHTQSIIKDKEIAKEEKKNTSKDKQDIDIDAIIDELEAMNDIESEDDEHGKA